MSHGFLDDRKQALENAFFAKKNKELLDKVKAELNASEQRAALQEATGIDDDAMLDNLLGLGVEVESLAAMSIAPLVLVAWADGVIDIKERSAILKGAEESGIKPGSTAQHLLEGWLEERPSSDMQAAWQAYTSGLCASLQAGDLIKLQERILGRCKKVAEAAGGFLGLGSISASEQAVLDQLAAAFEPA